MEQRIDDEISLAEIYLTLVQGKKLIIVLALMGGLLGGGFVGVMFAFLRQGLGWQSGL